MKLNQVLLCGIFLYVLPIIAMELNQHNDANMKLAMAISNGNVEQIKEAIKEGANPDQLPNPLLYAVVSRNEDLIKFLIAHDADPNFEIYPGTSVMRLAATIIQTPSVRDTIITLLKNWGCPRKK